MQDKHLYHLAIDWKKRLSNEIPFFQTIFKENGCKKILDCACGTGQHAIALARMGFSVSGSDIDPKAIRIARKNARKEKSSAYRTTFGTAAPGGPPRSGALPGPFQNLPFSLLRKPAMGPLREGPPQRASRCPERD